MHMHKPAYFYFRFEIRHHRVPQPRFPILRGNSGDLQTFKVEISIFIFAKIFRTFWSKMAVLEGEIGEGVVQCWPPNELLILGIVTSVPLWWKLIKKCDHESEDRQTDTCRDKPHHTTTVLQPFLPGQPGWAGGRRELLDFMVEGEINKGRHTDHPAGRHSIPTNQCPPPPSPHIFMGWIPFLPPNKQCQSTEGSDKLDL